MYSAELRLSNSTIPAEIQPLTVSAAKGLSLSRNDERCTDKTLRAIVPSLICLCKKKSFLTLILLGF
jgi:hypothetical protein